MNITAKAKTGQYIGHQLENGVIEFLGIPYAKTPKRWKKAEPLEASDMIFEAKEDGPACWQEVQAEEWPGEPPMSEDCLTLNIWTSDINTKNKPVFVWIHGGCYATGSSRTDCYNGIYCGDKFVETSPDIVYVNINYRIGILGSLDLSKYDADGEYEGSVNLQTLDQIEALRWIHENIGAFGGDPEKVTISGQSAGGMSVATLLSLSEANQYFRGAICQSTALSEAFYKTKESAAKLAERFYKIAGVESLQELLDMPARILRDHAVEFFYSMERDDPGAFEQLWGWDIFPENPCEELRNGCAKDVKLMIGSVSGEFDTAAYYMSDEEVKEAAKSVFPDEIDDAFVEQFAANYPERDRRTSYQDLWNDALLRMGSVVTADCQAQGGGDVYMYYMSFVPDGAKIRPQHCFEIPYTNMKKDNLAYMDYSTDEPVQGNNPSDILEKQLHGCWANFTRYGDPNGSHLDVEWPLYTVENNETAVIDHTWTIENGVRNKDTRMLKPLNLLK